MSVKQSFRNWMESNVTIMAVQCWVCYSIVVHSSMWWLIFYEISLIAIGLSEEFSDIDFYTSEDDFGKLRNMLKCLDENAMDMKKPHACVTLSVDSLNVDVTSFIGGVNKTYT